MDIAYVQQSLGHQNISLTVDTYGRSRKPQSRVAVLDGPAAIPKA